MHRDASIGLTLAAIMNCQGQITRQVDSSGGGGTCSRESTQQHLEKSNMEEQLDSHSVETYAFDKSVLEPKPDSIASETAADESVELDWKEEHYDDVSTTSDEDGQYDNRTTTGEMSSSSGNMLLVPDDDDRAAGGMKTRGNRRPIQLTERMRQKRQTLQDMAKPLKAWLYEHRDHPYPTKNEKLVLAVGSQMTMVQVSNWFANARRHLKNTVRQPGLTWSKRIKLYNSHVTGNAERLSISSSMSSISEDALEFEDDHVPDGSKYLPQLHCYETTSNYSSRPPSTMSQDAHLPTEYQPEAPQDEGALHKFKHTIMHRYLNDSFEQAQRYQEQYRHDHHLQGAEGTARRRNGSGTGSVSSHDYEDVSLSRLTTHSDPSNDSRPEGSALFDELAYGDLAGTIRKRLESSGSSEEDEDTYWKEINAALALTNMARACRQQQPIEACFR